MAVRVGEGEGGGEGEGAAPVVPSGMHTLSAIEVPVPNCASVTPEPIAASSTAPGGAICWSSSSAPDQPWCLRTGVPCLRSSRWIISTYAHAAPASRTKLCHESVGVKPANWNCHETPWVRSGPAPA